MDAVDAVFVHGGSRPLCLSQRGKPNYVKSVPCGGQRLQQQGVQRPNLHLASRCHVADHNTRCLVTVCVWGGVARQHTPITRTHSVCVPTARTHSTCAFPLQVRTPCACPHRKYILRVAGSLRGCRSWASSRHSCCCSVSTVLRCSSCSCPTCSRKLPRRASCRAVS